MLISICVDALIILVYFFFKEEDTTGVSYDVPRSGSEQPLDLDSALDWLGRLESQITSATSRLLGCAGPHWRSPQKLEPRISELKAAVASLTTGLRQLTLFIHPILLSQQDKGIRRHQVSKYSQTGYRKVKFQKRTLASSYGWYWAYLLSKKCHLIPWKTFV